MPASAPAPTRTAPRAKATYKGQVAGSFPMPGGRLLCVIVDNGKNVGGTAHLWDSSGKEQSSFKFPEAAIAGAGHAPSGQIVFVCQESIYRFNPDGTHTTEKIAGVKRANFQSDGSALLQFGEGDLKRRGPDGTLKDVVQVLDRGLSYWPVVLADDAIALVAKEQPRRLLLFDREGKPTADIKLAGNGATSPTQTPDGRIAVCSMETLHLVGPGKKHVKARLSTGVRRAVALPNGWVAVATKLGTVEFFDAGGKRKASFRRDPLGSGETKLGIARMADGTVIAPSKKGTIYRLSPTGELLGALALEGLADDPEALDDGSAALCDGKAWHFVGASDFGAAKAPEGPPDLSAEHPKLREHFAPWTLTPRCKEVLDELLERLTKVEREGRKLTLAFSTDEGEVFEVQFGAPDKASGKGYPQSYQDVCALHADIVFGEGPPFDVHFGSCMAELSEEESERYSELCDAGQKLVPL
jgi:hypothetical protein